MDNRTLYCFSTYSTHGTLAGWGGRIRTSEWRDQNPLPYHLATPQLGKQPRSIGPQSFKQGRVIQSASQKANKFLRHPTHDFLPKIQSLTGQKYTGPRASQARRTVEREPIERTCNFWIAASHNAQAIVPSTGRQETVNCDGRRIPCQFRILKHPGGADKDIRL